MNLLESLAVSGGALMLQSTREKAIQMRCSFRIQSTFHGSVSICKILELFWFFFVSVLFFCFLTMFFKGSIFAPISDLLSRTCLSPMSHYLHVYTCTLQLLTRTPHLQNESHDRIPYSSSLYWNSCLGLLTEDLHFPFMSEGDPI